MFVDIKITNRNENETNLEVYPFTAESGAWMNGVNLDIFGLFNANQTLSPSLKPGEIILLRLPFDLLEEHFSKSSWAKIDQRKFVLVLSLYPVKTSMLVYKK